MHSCPFNSPSQLVSRLVMKRDHADRRQTVPVKQRRRKADRREFAHEQKIALIKWGEAAMFGGCEL